MLTIACVLRSGGHYDSEYVDRLRRGVEQHLSGARFVCLSDVDVSCQRIPLKHGWPGWWSKLELFRPDIEGDLLTLDLDTMIAGDLSDIAGVGKLTVLHDFYAKTLQDGSARLRKNTGVMYLPHADRACIWNEWIKNPEAHMARCGNRGDGMMITELYGDRAQCWQDVLPGQVVSYKCHVRPSQHARETGDGTVPANARVVCFHGEPRPRDVGWRL